MTCHDARELFSALLDDALTADARARLDAHLATCGECGRELDRFRRTVALVQGLPPERAPAGFVDRVVAAARPEPWTTRLARRLFVPWTVKLPLEAAALLLVGGLAVLVFRGTEEQQRAARVDELRARVEQPAPVPGAGGRESESPSPAPDAASRAAEPPPARRDPTSGARDAARDAREQPAVPPAPTQGPAPPHAPEAPKASASPRAPGAPQGAGASGEAADSASAPRRQAPGKREPAPSVESDRRQKSAPAQAPAGQAVAPGTQADGTARESKPREDVVREESAGRLGAAARSAAVAQVGGTLLVPDARAAAAKIEGLARGLGGAVAGRRDDGEALFLEVAVPRERYPDLVRELARLGQWRPHAEPPALPPSVRVVIRLPR
ncbi:MAG: zf-HC2 domain-containing protein [Candidatus Rokuibacteriota bacterium]